MARGEILRFVEELQQDNAKQKDESVRLYKLAEENGIKTTPASIAQAIYVVRKRKGLVSPRALARQKRKANRDKPKPKQTIRSSALENYLEDAVRSISLLKGEIQRLRAIERNYLKIKSQFE
jgi:hypothetical protein